LWLDAVSRLPSLHVGKCRAPATGLGGPAAVGPGAPRRLSDGMGHGHDHGGSGSPSSVRLYRCVTCFGEEDGDGEEAHDGGKDGPEDKDGGRVEVDPRLACAFCTAVLHAGHSVVYVKEVRLVCVYHVCAGCVCVLFLGAVLATYIAHSVKCVCGGLMFREYCGDMS
jgi:hypothetical protein